jgi:diguanylate cyclase (GGDEF)-like protein
MHSIAVVNRAITPLRELVRLRTRWVQMAIAMACLLVIYACWQLSGWPAENRPLVGDVFFYPVGAAAIVAAWMASRRCGNLPRLMWAWRLIALASGAYLAGDVAQTIYELSGGKPYPSVADGFYLLFYPLMLWGLLWFPAPGRSPGERVRLGLDLTVVAIGGFVVVMYVVLGPTVVQGGSNPLQVAFSIAYPVGDMVLLVGAGSVMLRARLASSASSLRLIVVGLLFYVIADLVYGYITLHGEYQGGDPVDSVWMIAIAILALAGAAQSRPLAPSVPSLERPRQGVSWLPFIAVTMGVVLLLVNQRNDPLFPDESLLLGTVLMAILVSARQFLAQRDLIDTQGRLSYQSLHDPLTGLPNRALVLDRAEQMLARARRAQTPLAALYVDLDGFKQVNDSLGHAAGDELLQVVASRLTGVVREADTVGRLGGDEFVVLLEDYAIDVEPELVAERICDVISQPVEFEQGERPTAAVTVSVGVASGLRNSADELVRDADLALYQAKARGKNRWIVYEARMQTAIKDRIELEMDLREALQRDQLFLLYQPTFDLSSERMTGVEALVRWRHPKHGVIAPDRFIKIAEDSGLIVPMGRWIMRTACQQAAAWQRQGHPLGIAINISARQLDEPALPHEVDEILKENRLDPELVTLEITETTLMRDVHAATLLLGELKGLGVRIAIDDFGTGYSSLAYLRQFPVDALKIDRSFITNIATSTDSKTLIHTLVQLGKQLGLETLGEGIEQEAQLRQLQREQCDSGQGFLFARPLQPRAINELLATGEPLPPRPAADTNLIAMTNTRPA